MDFHPIASDWPLMDGEEFAALVESVSTHGVKVACWLYEGKILDGRNRYRAAEEAGVEVEDWHEFEGTPEEARELAELLNDRRRHLTREERIERVRKLREKGLSTRAIADVVGVDQKTVRNDLKRGEDMSSPAHPDEGESNDKQGDALKKDPPATLLPFRGSPDGPQERVTGLDGKKYPARKSEPAPARKPDNTGLKTLLSQLTDLTDSLNNGRGFWADARRMEDKERWELADQLERLSKAMYRRATELRNRAS